jgi:hypothetical protein
MLLRGAFLISLFSKNDLPIDKSLVKKEGATS